MKLSISIDLAVVFISTLTIVCIIPSSNTLDRQDRYLQLFKVVKIPNFVCGNNTRGGVCVNNADCGRLGGINVGTCAQGYGICCLVLYNCTSSPETVTVNGSHIQSPSKLSAPNMCQYILQRPEGVCQVRLDFKNFNTSDGSDSGVLTGDCDTDMLIVSGASNADTLGPLCGNLTGQHMYLDYGTGNSITLDINTIMMLGQVWDIQVTYIKCNSPEKAPDGCLQYFTTATGTVQSFNYPNMHQKNNEMYSICIKPLPGFSSITWNTCGGVSDFFIAGQPGIDGLPDSFMAYSGDQCDTDYFMIGGDDKYCGNSFQGPVTTMAQPFVAYVNFNQDELTPDPVFFGDFDNTGFCMQWMQGR